VLSGCVADKSSAVRPTTMFAAPSTMMTDGTRRSPPISMTSGDRSPTLDAATV
jgi:hypothetical protein